MKKAAMNRENPMKTMKNAWSRMALAPLAAALLLAGCATALPPAEPLAGVQPPAAFSTPQEQASWTTAAPAEAQPRGEWWRAFADAELTALVERAAVANTDVQTAAARLTEARALLRSADAQRMPQLGASAGAARQAGANTANGTQPATLLTAGLNLSYEVDLFGRLSNASEAARQDAQAQAALLQSTRLMVQADVAQTYLQLRSLQTERQLVQQSLSAYRDTLRLIESRHRAGDAAELDVVRMQSEVSTTEAETLALERQQATLTHALAVLVGDVATGFVLPAPAGQTALPVIPAGVPATVLARRPDVSAAQARVLAAQARVGVAQAAWFPAISLTGAGLCLARSGRPLQVVGPLLGTGCAVVAADLRWRSARGAGGGCQGPSRSRRGRAARAGAWCVARRRGPAQHAAPAAGPGRGAGAGRAIGRACHASLGCALSQRPCEPARIAGCAPQ